MKEYKCYEQHYQDLIELLAQERKRLLLSQSELAKRIGLHQSDISKIEKFERKLELIELMKWLAVMRVSDNAPLIQKIMLLIGLNQDEHCRTE